jgi:hypothetical protein
MTKKSRVLFVVLAYLAMGVTGGFANKHHHHNSTETQDNQANTAAIKNKQLCFLHCDHNRADCEVGGTRSAEECSRERSLCQGNCDRYCPPTCY